jgi:transglutaminase-like putative cysteine protease
MQKIFFIVLILAAVGLRLTAWADVPQSRLVDFNYEVLIEGIPEQTKELKVWFPYLSETPYQEIEEVNIEPQAAANISYDKTYHNKILNYMIVSPQSSSLRFNVSYRVKRLEYSNKHALSRSLLGEDDLLKYLQADRMVTLSPKIKAIAQEIIQGKTTTMDKARAIYDYVFKNVSYDKTTPGWGNGDTERVCVLKSGNCTDFHSLFISLARASGIPAKFVMGVPLANDKKEGEIPGYHCWAEFYEEELGWVPVDISEAWKNKSKYEYYFGTIGADRLEISIGRDIVLEPNANTEPLNYFLYPYVEVDGERFLQIKTVFRFKDVNRRKEVSKL